MSFATCRHVKEDGYLCQSPALRRGHYCYYHDSHRARRMKMAQARSRGEMLWLDLPPLEDMRAVQAATAHVIEAIAAGVIEPKRARLLLTALRLAASNFKCAHAWNGGSEYENRGWHESVVSYPHLEREFGLPANIDLDADPDQVFPPKTSKPGTPPLPRWAGHQRSALHSATEPGFLNAFAALDPREQAAVAHDVAEALHGSAGKKPPASAETPPSIENTDAGSGVA